MMKNKIIDLFCGCGGLSKGFENAGYEVVLAIDFWKDAIETYNLNHKNKVGKCCDIHTISNEFLQELNKNNEVVGVVGGPPCQGFSTVGKREIDDPRNSLYKEYCRVVEQINPDFFVLENVKGLLTLNNGSYRDKIIEDFSKLGYTVTYKILNANQFGIPQRRERVFFVGLKNKEFKFPEQDSIIVTTEEALCDLPTPIDSNTEKCDYLFEPRNDYQKYLRENSDYITNHGITNHSESTIEIISQIPDGGNIKSLPKEFWSVRKYNKAFERMNSKSFSNTIDTGHRNYFHYKENRIPTTREVARIQSFQDDFQFFGSKTSQYKQVGNAVPPLLAYKVAKNIKKQLGGSNEN